jgi:hypothetical protein
MWRLCFCRFLCPCCKVVVDFWVDFFLQLVDRTTILLKFQYCWTSGSTSLVSNTMGLTVYELPCRVETWYARNQNGGNKGTQNCDRRFQAEQQDMNYRTTW